MKKRLPLLMLLVAMLSMAIVACDTDDVETDDTIDEDVLSDEEVTVDEDLVASYVSVQDVLGTQLYFPEAEEAEGLETVVIDDLFFDPDGTIQYVVIDTGQLFDEDNRTIAIPRDQLGRQQLDSVTVIGTTATVEETGTFTEIDTGLLEGIGIGDELGGEFAGLLRATNYEEYEVINTAEEDLGDVETMAVELEDLTISYAIMDVGGFLGLSENVVAIPFERFGYSTEEDTFVLDVSEEQLEEAPVLDPATWNMGEADWDAGVVDYWDDF